MKKLHLTFLNEDGSKKTLVLHCVHQELTPAQVKEAMIQITELDLFEKDGVRLMTDVYSAKYVEVIETPLFDSQDLAISRSEESDSDKNTSTIEKSPLMAADPQFEQVDDSIDDTLDIVMIENESSIEAEVPKFRGLRSSVVQVFRMASCLLINNKKTSRLRCWLKRWESRPLLRC